MDGSKLLVDYVNPMIGTDAHGHLYPDERDNTRHGSSGYHYSDTSILGFSHNHLTGIGCHDLGELLTMGPTPSKSLGSAPGESGAGNLTVSREVKNLTGGFACNTKLIMVQL